MTRVLTLSTAMVLVATLAWASLFYFRFVWTPDWRKAWYKVAIYASLSWHSAAFVLSPPPPLWQLISGIATALVSLVIFWSAVWAHRRQRPAFAFVRVPPTWLTRRGPYRFVRHPFYLSFIMAAVAGTLLSSQWPLATTAVGLFAFYFAAAREEEAAFLAGELSDEYREYQARTGMFLPQLLPMPSHRTRSPP